jgi:hypothetical protein
LRPAGIWGEKSREEGPDAQGQNIETVVGPEGEYCFSETRSGEYVAEASLPGFTSASATGYLRIAADRHYLTDVLVGAAIGGAVGWAVPRLFDRRPPSDPEATALRSPPPVVAFSFVFGGGSADRPGGVLVTGGLRGGGPYVSATWGF